MSKSDRKSLIESISNWLKLLALIVLVAEGVIVIAIQITPKDSVIYPWYPVFMLFFLLVVVVAIFVDRSGQRKIQQLQIDGQKIEVDPEKVKIRDMESIVESPGRHINSRLKFSLIKPTGKDIQEEYLSLGQLYVKMGIASSENLQPLFEQMTVMPFGKMMANATNVVLQFGQNYELQMTGDSSTDQINKYLKHVKQAYKTEKNISLSMEELTKTRRSLMLGDSSLVKINYFNGFIMQIYDKTYAAETYIPTTLPNIFSTIQIATRESIEKIISNEESILWGTSNHIKNVEVNGTSKDFSIYRMYYLIENKDFIYQLQLQWSPQTSEAISTWEDLKKMQENFRIARN